MKHRIAFILCILLCLSLSVLFVSCGGDNGDGNTPGDNTGGDSGNTDLAFTDVYFRDVTVDYDGNPHILAEVEGAPEGTTIVYTGRESRTDAGTYTATATLSKDGYTTKELTAKLVIRKIDYDMSQAKWDYSDAFTYDGSEKTVTVSGLPEGVTVSSYAENAKTDAGTYSAKVNFSYDTVNYNQPTLPDCSWTINKAVFNNVQFKGVEVDYDGNPHTITVTGNIPSTASISYSSDVDGIENTATEIGEYNITATVTDKNFETKQLSAKLVIKVVDDERALLVSGNTLFFQNAKDENKLYAYNFTNNKLIKVSNGNAVNMVADGNNRIAFVSKSLLSAIRTAAYDEETDKVSNDLLISKNARYIQRESNNIYYYVVNGLTKDKSGIFKVDFSTQDPTVTCLSVGKAKDLQLYGSTLYFADGNNDYKLSSVNTTAENQTRNLVLDEKISNLVVHNGVLYFTVNHLLGNYIARYTISSGVVRKLTQDAGIDLTVVGSDLYYVNVDKFTTAVVGNGIYKVNANPATDNHAIGTKVIDGGEYGVCSLTAKGTDLIYYDCDGYKLIRYSTGNQSKVDLLDGFVKPEDPTPLSTGSQVEYKDGIIYYLDIWDGKTLHSYNTVTKENRALTSVKVDNFAIVGDYIYLNTVSFGVNNDTYRIYLKTNDEPLLINTYDSVELVSDGTYIYYVERNAAGVATAIHKANMDGTDDTVIFEYAADNLVLYEGTLYFCAKPTAVQTIMKIENVAKVTSAQPKTPVNDKYACDVFTICDGVIFFRQNYSIGYQNHRLARMNIDGTGYTEMVTSQTDPMEIIVKDGYVYYANAAATANDYCLYKIAVNGKEGDQVALTSGKYVTAICITGDKAYFVDYYTAGALGDSHLYEVSLDGTGLTKIA